LTQYLFYCILSEGGIKLSFLKKLIRKKKEGKIAAPKEVKKPTDLELICGDDKEVYEALYDTMPPDPRRSNVSMEEAAREAEDFEKSGDALRARASYHIAGGLAIFRGDVEKVKQYFGKCKELSPGRNYKILENPEKAVQKAQEYYKKYLKEEAKK